jgi:heptosyltransferase-2
LRIVNRRKRILAEVLDKIGLFLCVFGSVRRKCQKSTEIKNILAIRLAYIGDVVLTIPALKPLADRFPSAKVSFLTSSKAEEVLENNPYVHELITYDAPWFYPQKSLSVIRDYVRVIRLIRSKQFDMAVDFRGDLRNIMLVIFPSGASRKVGYDITGGGYLLDEIVPCRGKTHKVQFHLDIVRALGANSRSPDTMNLYPLLEDREKVLRLLREIGIKQQDFLVGLHPGGRSRLKCWDITSYAEVANLLIERHGAKVVITGGPDEGRLGDTILRMVKRGATNLCGSVSLRQLQVLLQHVKLFITNDTAALHIASGANTPTVAIFGPSEVWDTGPLSAKNRVVMKNLKCRASCDTYRCDNESYHECLRSIRPAEVIQACEELMEEKA